MRLKWDPAKMGCHPVLHLKETAVCMCGGNANRRQPGLVKGRASQLALFLTHLNLPRPAWVWWLRAESAELWGGVACSMEKKWEHTDPVAHAAGLPKRHGSDVSIITGKTQIDGWAGVQE